MPDWVIWPVIGVAALLAGRDALRLTRFRNFFRARPGLLRLVLGGGLATGLLLGAAALWQPRALAVLAGAYAAAAAVTAFRSRADHGLARGLPPGRVTLLPRYPASETEAIGLDAQRYGSIFKTGSTAVGPGRRPAVCVVGNALGRELLRKHESSLEVHPRFRIDRVIPRGFLRSMSGDDHSRYSVIFREAMVLADTELFRWECAALAVSTFGRLADDYVASDEEGVVPAPYLQSLASTALFRLLFGLGPGSESFDRLTRELAAFDAKPIPRRFGLGRARRRLRALEASAMALSAPESVLQLALDTARAQSIDLAPIPGNIVQMQLSGENDLAGLLSWIVKYLADEPSLLDALRADPSKADELAARIVAETLRLQQSEWISRRASREIEFGGFRIPAGWSVRICVREAHRSSTAFQSPLVFDPDRFRSSEEYAPFGLHRHHCTGRGVVYSVAEAMVLVIARGYDLKTVRDSPPHRPRYHVEPGKDFRIAVVPRRRSPGLA